MKILKTILGLLVIILISNSCDIDKLNDFTVIIELDAVKNKKELIFTNANTSGTEISNIKVSFSGGIASEIYSLEGTKVSNLNHNIQIIGLNRKISVSTENEEVVIMKVEADGFVTKNVPLLFNGNELESIKIPLLEKENLPKSIQIIEQEVSLNNGVLENNLNIKVENPNGGENLLNFSIDEETKIIDENGNEIIANNLSITLQTFDTSADALEENGSFSAVSEITPYLNAKSGEQIIPFSTFKVEIKANGNDVFLSKPFKITLPNPLDNSVSPKSSSKANNLIIEEDLSMSVFQGDDLFNHIPNHFGQDLSDQLLNSNIEFINNFGDILSNGLGSSSSNFTSGFWVLGARIPACAIYNLNFSNTSIGTVYQIQAASTLAPDALMDFKQISIGYNDKYTIFETFRNTRNNLTQFSFGQFPVDARLKITAKLIDGSSVVVYDQVHNNCSLNDLEIDVTVPNQNSEFIDQNMRIECSSESLFIDNHNIIYAKSSDFDTSNPNFYLYGVVKEGRLTGLAPILENETDYLFVKFTGERFTLKGKDVKFLIDNIDQEDFCTKIGR